MKLALAFVATILCSCSMAFAEDVGTPTLAARAQDASGGSAAATDIVRLTTSSNAVWAQLDFGGDWDPDHRHWDHPSNMIIYTDGSVFVYAHHLANMRRNGGIGDQGDTYTFLVNIVIYNGAYVNKMCQGSVIASKDVVLDTLDYRDEFWDVNKTVNAFSADILSQGHCFMETRWIR
jgi:hypothetical protein